MKLILDLLQGMGLSAATGLRPFLPALLAGALAAGDLGIDFDGTDFAFLEASWFLLALAVALVAALLLRGPLSTPAGDSALQGAGIGLGALLFAGTLDDRHDTWWYGLLLGAAFAILAASVSRSLLGRVRERFVRGGDTAAAGALPLYAEGAAVVLAGASVLFPPLALVGVGFLALLAVRGRGREDRKYAGLRILR